MILIISEKSDSVTFKVCKWIEHFGEKYAVLNTKELYGNNIEIDISNRRFTLTIGNNVLNSEDIGAVWLRRYYYPKISLKEIINIPNEFKKSLETEFDSLIQSFYSILEDRFWLNKFEDNKFFKLDQLILAKKKGFSIPNTFIKNNQINQSNLITKPIEYPFIYKGLVSYTEEVNNIIKMDEGTTFPSLFQERVKSKYEVRSVYLDGNTYSVAMVSLKNNETVPVDIRKSRNKNLITPVPYKLPKEIEFKMNSFMKERSINFGSFDFLKTDGEYVFLEVNPFGQFENISIIGGYSIEQKIAKLLIKNDRKRI